MSFGRFSDDPAGRVDQGLDPEVDPEAREFRIVRSKALVHVDLELMDILKLFLDTGKMQNIISFASLNFSLEEPVLAEDINCQIFIAEIHRDLSLNVETMSVAVDYYS